MSNLLKYRAPSNMNDNDSTIALYYRAIKKICRNCHATLPIDSDKCRNCNSKDLRLKHKIRKYNGHHDQGQGGYGLNSMRIINLKEIRKNFKY